MTTSPAVFALVATCLCLSVQAQNLVSGSCVTSYDPAVDYFPTKLSQEYSTGFSVTYSNSYKLITGPNIGTIVAYQCGTPAPNATALGADLAVSIPLQSVSLLSTTQIPFVELLGERLAINSVHGSTDTEGEVTVSSPCLRQLIQDGAAHNFPTVSWNAQLGGLPDNTDAVFCSAGFGCSADAQAAADSVGAALIPVGDSGEATVLGAAEWLEYFALFFNREAAAVSHVAQVDSRYGATAAAVAAIAPAAGSRPKVLWAYYYFGWYAGSCPNYYCAVVESAGGDWLQMPDGAPNSWGGFDALTDDAFFAAAAEADVWLFPDMWESKVAASGSGVNMTRIAALPAYANGRVYDFTMNSAYGPEANDWFESRMAEPDFFLKDLAAIITPAGVSATYERTWWRDVLTESPRAAGTCADPAAPLELWARGCVTSYDPAVDYFPTKLSQEYSTGFSVTYSNSYKLITGPNIGTIVAYQCGTPAPNATALGADLAVSIPLQSVSLLSTTQIPFVELLGERLAINSVHGSTDTEGEVTVSSPCLRQLIQDGAAHNFPTVSWNAQLGGLPDNTDAVFCSAGFGCSADAQAAADSVGAALIPVGDSGEATVLGAAEWLEYFALFFNREAAAVSHVAQVDSRYGATAAAVAAIAPAAGSRPKVLWAYYYFGWYAGSCPNYYCAVVESAGGDWLQMPDGAPNSWGGFDALTDDAFFAAAAEADVWLFPDMWESKVAASGSGVNMTRIAALPAYANGRVYDFTMNSAYGPEANDWFESRMAEPDFFLKDLAAIITPAGVSATYERTWWRDVLTESPRAAGTCADPAAPLELWADSATSPSPTPAATVLTATATYAIDLTTIAVGSTARTTFETEFKAAVVTAMAADGVTTGQVNINSITAGSVVVDFSVFVPTAIAAAATATFGTAVVGNAAALAVLGATPTVEADTATAAAVTAAAAAVTPAPAPAPKASKAAVAAAPQVLAAVAAGLLTLTAL